jgi:hypothetical protein
MKTCLLYGFLLALANFLITLILFICGLHSDAAHLSLSHWVSGLSILILPIVFFVLGIKARRDALPPEEGFGYGQAFGVGFGIQLFASLFVAVTTYAYAAFIDPHFTDVALQAQADAMQARGMSSEQIDRAQSMMHMFMSPVAQAVAACFISLVMGVIILLIVAAFLRRPSARDPLAI